MQGGNTTISDSWFSGSLLGATTTNCGGFVGWAANGYNSAAITEGEGEENATVTIDGRTLFKDYSWNTLCLPFSMTEDEVNTQLYPDWYNLMELDTDGDHDGKKTGFDPDDGTLYLYFKRATSIEAGKPYIIRWNKDYNGKDINIYYPAFYGVTITSTTPTTVTAENSGLRPVQFVGTYSHTPLAKNDQSNLYLGADNTLYYPNVDGFSIGAFRAYFHIDLEKQTALSRVVINFGDDETTNIQNVQSSMFNVQSDAWYSLDGRRLSGKPTQKGIYINNGNKVVVK